MNAMQLAMINAGVVSGEALLKAEAEEREARRVEAARLEQIRLKAEAAERAAKKAREEERKRVAKIRKQSAQLATSDDTAHQREAHRRYLDGTPRKAPVEP